MTSKTQPLAICLSPTTVIFVDDNRQFLNAIEMELDTNKFIPKFFNDPDVALEFLKKSNDQQFNLQNYIFHPEENKLEHHNLEVDVTSIRNQIYNPNRFSAISQTVVDYAMPKLNGLDFSAKIINKSIKKLMLTGEASESLAVKAFNENLIDKFIQKDAANFSQIINESICELQQQYFLQLSTIVFDSIVGNMQSPHLSWSHDPAFIKLFNEIFIKSKAIEYYLLDSQGSYLFLDVDANPTWLIVADDDELNDYQMIAQYGEAPATIINALKNRKVVPYFHTEIERKRISPTEWESYLHPVNVLEGKKKYYYAYINDPSAYDIQPSKITSYRQYLFQHLK